MDLKQYLAAVAATTETGSDYAVAKVLGVERQHVSQWQRGVSLPDAYNCLTIARVLQLDALRVLADIERERAERAGQTAKADKWRAWLERAATTAGAVILSVWTGLQPAGDAHGAPVARAQALATYPVVANLYIVARCLARWLRALCTLPAPVARLAVAA